MADQSPITATGTVSDRAFWAPRQARDLASLQFNIFKSCVQHIFRGKADERENKELGAVTQLCPYTSPLIQQDRGGHSLKLSHQKRHFSKFFRGLTSYPK